MARHVPRSRNRLDTDMWLKTWGKRTSSGGSDSRCIFRGGVSSACVRGAESGGPETDGLSQMDRDREIETEGPGQRDQDRRTG